MTPEQGTYIRIATSLAALQEILRMDLEKGACSDWPGSTRDSLQKIVVNGLPPPQESTDKIILPGGIIIRVDEKDRVVLRAFRDEAMREN